MADLRARVRRLEELSRLFSIEEGLFKDCDTAINVQLSFNDRPWSSGPSRHANPARERRTGKPGDRWRRVRAG